MEQEINGRTQKLKLNDVGFVLDLRTNLISMSRAQRTGIEIKFIPGDDALMKAVENSTTIMHEECFSLVICEIVRMKPTNRKEQHEKVFNAGINDTFQLMHKRAAHISNNTMQRMLKSGQYLVLTL